MPPPFAAVPEKSQKAVVYFRRALKLDRKYLSAWTLMGHEYVEMKNTPAAIDAYRRAVDINPRDYRAWYGLGQTYEILHMPYYSLYYYRRATQLRPQDARMWCAMGQCYESEQLGLREHAVRCYRRALDNNEGEGIALAKLAKLHQAMGDEGEAAEYHRMATGRPAQPRKRSATTRPCDPASAASPPTRRLHRRRTTAASSPTRSPE